MTEIVVAAGQAPRAAPRRRRGSALIAGCLLVSAAVALMAALGPALASHQASAQDLALGLSKPSGAHLLGTDTLGRDVLARLVVGARTAFVGPLVIAVGSMLLGNLLGLTAGFRGGRVDALIMRWVDLMYALPGLLVLVVVIGALGGGYWLAVAMLVVLNTPFDTRVVRGATLEQAPRPYVEAARTLGVSEWRIMALHVWPNVAATAVANTFLVFATSLVALSGLSFLGLGVHPGQADWGLMLAESRNALFSNPVAALAPGALIVLTATCMNLTGDWLYEHVSSRGAKR